MKKIIITFLFCVLISLPALAGYRNTSIRDSSVVDINFPYPSIPGSLRSVPERTAYLSEHYWDKYDFSDTALIYRSEVTEQGLVNFLDLLGRMDSLTAAPAVSKFMSDVTRAPSASREYFSGQLEHYLFNPESPMRNGELYLSFLQCRLQYPHLSETDRKLLEFRLKNLQKNRIGHQASDFAYVDRKGRKSTLYSTVGEYILLYFNNPSCENCHIATRKLKNLALLTDPRIKVLAVYPDADTAEWTTHTRQIPLQWIDARSSRGEIISKSLYFIQAMLTLYLLDKNKRVILKDCSPEELGADLHQILKR